MSSVAAVWLVSSLVGIAFARPEYSRKEGVACEYCHKSGSPGTLNQVTNRRESTDLTARGLFYGSHNHSFQGYVEAALPAPRGFTITFRYLWKEEFKTLPRRMAVGDVTGDGKPRLILLNEKPDDKNSSTLEVRRWDGKSFVTEFTGDVRAPADRLAVGKLAGADKPAVILTSDALWRWDGTTFTRQAAPSPMPLLGTTRLQDGSDRVLLAPASNNILAYRVNLTAVRKDDWLVDPMTAPSPPQNLWGDMHTTPEFLNAMGVPDQLSSGGLLGIWKINKIGAYFIYHMERDFDIGPDPDHPGKPKVTYNNTYYVTLRDRNGIKLWTSPKLPGEGYDIVLDDPRAGGKPGFLVLFNGTTSGKGRTVAFFPMD